MVAKNVVTFLCHFHPRRSSIWRPGIWHVAILLVASAGTAFSQLLVEPGSPEDKPALDAARKVLESAAAAGDAAALRKLADEAPTSMEAFELTKRGAELGDTESQNRLAAMLASGQGTVRDLPAAIEWGRKAAASGESASMRTLGLILLFDSESPPDRREGLDWLEKAAAAGDTKAAIRAATVHVKGQAGHPVDESRAVKLLTPLAESGDAECQIALASVYHFGKSFSDQRAMAVLWLERARELGHPQATQLLQQIREEALKKYD